MEDPVNTGKSNFVFKGTKLEFIVDGKYEPWFKAKIVAEMLNYKCPNQMADTLVDINFKTSYEALLNQECCVKHLFHVQPDTVFINEQGLHKLIISSALQQTVEFQDWVYGVVLPSIRKTAEGILKEEYNRIIGNLRQELQETRPDRVIRTKDQNKNPYFYLIKKNVDSKYPYYVLRVQKLNVQSTLKKITKAYPRRQILLRLTGNPYTVNLYNRIKESGYIEFRGNDIRTSLSEENLIHVITVIDSQRF